MADTNDNITANEVYLIHSSFATLAVKCEYCKLNDCRHPDIDFNSMSCCLQNCPLLLEDI